MRLRKLGLIAAILLAVTTAYAAVTVTVNGSNYSIPQTNERGWGNAVTSWIQAISANTLQPTGGSFILTSDVDFGSNYGLKSSYLLSRSANLADDGFIRLSKTDTIAWRNNANTDNLVLGVDASDNLTFNGTAFPSLSNIVTLDGTQTLTNKTLTAPVINSPTGIVKGDVGLGNVDNTSDATKNAAVATLTNKTLTAPIISTISNTGTLTLPTSTDTLVGRATTDTLTNKTLTSPVINSPTGITKSDVGLGNVDNTSDATKNSAAVILTNKDIDGGTASNTSRITLPKAAKTTLDGLTRKAGTIVYDTTTSKPYYDDGSNLKAIGSGSGGGANYLVNGDAELGTSSWTAASGSSVLASESTVVVEGLKSIKVTMTSVNGDSVYQDVTPTPVQLGGVNIGYQIWIKTSLTTLQACARQGGVVVGSCLNVLSDNVWHPYLIPYAGPSSGSVGIGIKTTSSTSGDYYFDDAKIAPGLGIGSGTPPNTFTSNVLIGGGTANETPQDWISGNCSISDTSLYSCTLTGFTASPSCEVTPFTGGNDYTAYITNISATNVTVRTYSGGTKTASEFFIRCSKTGSDFVQPTITAQNYNYSGRVYAPTIGNGPTCSTSSYTSSRSGSKMILEGSCTVSGAGAAGTYSLDLPAGMTTTNTASVGHFYWNDSGTGFFTGTTDFTDNNTLLFKVNAATSSIQGNAFASGDRISFNVEFDAAENGIAWTETMNAPQLLGSVTSNAQNALREEYVTLNLSGASTVSVRSASSNWYTNFTASGTTVTGTWSGVWSAEPACNVTCNTSSSQVYGVFTSNPSTTGVGFACYNDSAVVQTSSYIALRCIGPR